MKSSSPSKLAQSPLFQAKLASALGRSSQHRTCQSIHRGRLGADFGNRFRDRFEAGLPRCSAHGVRKAGAVGCAKLGATAHQRMSLFGMGDAQSGGAIHASGAAHMMQNGHVKSLPWVWVRSPPNLVI